MLRTPRKLLARGMLLACSFALLPHPALAAKDRPSTVADLRYGVALYDYFQQNYLAALSELQVADTGGGIVGHGSQPQVLKGAMSLAFGMDRTATDIFEGTLAEDTNQRVSNSAWFYLARMRFRRNDWVGAQASLNRVDGDINPLLADEIEALGVDLAIRTGDLGRAVAALEQSDKGSDWKPYLYYNLGTAHIRSQDFDRGLGYLDQLVDMPLESSEHWSLQDKGLIAAGFSLMRRGEYQAAVERFSQVRMDSPLAEQALLGYGWSAVELGDYSKALGPWQILSDQSPLRPAVQEALLAVPYAYEKLGSYGSALQEFELAESVFSREIQRLESLKTGLEGIDLVELTAAGEYESPEADLDPQLSGLIELLSGEEFSLLRRDIRDIGVLRDRLNYWHRNIAIYQTMLEQRKVLRQQQLEQAQQQEIPAQLEQLALEREKLAAKLELSANDANPMALADAETKDLWLRMQRADATLQRIEAAGENADQERQWLERYRGMLLWQSSEQYPGWRWIAKKRLVQLDTALLEANENLHRYQQVVAEAPDILPFQQRLSALQTRLQHQRVAVNHSYKQTHDAAQQLLVSELSRQQKRLAHYQAQARLARARLYDSAQVEMQ